MENKIYRGELYYIDLEEKVGSEQSGCRPAVILQNNVGNKYSNTVFVAPITSKISQKAKLPTHIKIGRVSGLTEESLVLLEQIMVIDKIRLKEYVGLLSSKDMSRIDDGIVIALGLGNVTRGLSKENAIMYAELGLYNMLNSGNENTPDNLKVFMDGVFDLYPTIEKAEEMARKLKFKIDDGTCL